MKVDPREQRRQVQQAAYWGAWRAQRPRKCRWGLHDWLLREYRQTRTCLSCGLYQGRSWFGWYDSHWAKQDSTTMQRLREILAEQESYEGPLVDP